MVCASCVLYSSRQHRSSVAGSKQLRFCSSNSSVFWCTLRIAMAIGPEPWWCPLHTVLAAILCDCIGTRACAHVLQRMG